MATIVQRVLVIGGETAVWEKLRPLLSEGNRVGEVRLVDHYPSSEELARVVRLFPPDAVFLGFESVPAALLVMGELESNIGATPVVAFNRFDNSRAVGELMRAGVREIITPPFAAVQVEEALRRMAAMAKRRRLPEIFDNLCTFLPARSGVGTSTLACHLAKTAGAELACKVLFADFDLTSSAVRYFMNFHPRMSIRDAAEHAPGMEEWQWSDFVSRLGPVDVLSAGPLNLRRPLRAPMVRRLFEYASPHYGLMCADLSGNMESFSLEVMQASKAIFLVTGPDGLSLGAAREKVEFLASIDLASRAGLLIRESPQGGMPSVQEIERFCGLPVCGVFDYRSVRPKSTPDEVKEAPLPSGLTRQLAALARRLVEKTRSGSAGMLSAS